MEALTFGKILSKRQEVNNSADEARKYDIKAVVNVNTTEVTGFDDGTVSKDGREMATFNTYGKGLMNIGYTLEDDEADKKVELLTNIQTFIDSVKQAVFPDITASE